MHISPEARARSGPPGGTGLSERRQTSSFAALAARLEQGDGRPLHLQLYEHLRADIVSGVLRPGTRLPSTRALASVLGTSRNTVLHAFEELMTEGYLLSQRGSGTFVATDLPAPPRRAPQHPGLLPVEQAPCGPGHFRGISPALGISPIGIPFRPDLPALDQFPVKLWMRLAQRAIDRIARDPGPMLLGWCESSGHPPLREAIMRHLRAFCGIECRAEDVFIFAGPQQARDVALRVLLSPGDAVWLEEPAHPRTRASLEAASARIHPVSTGGVAFDARQAEAACPEARLAYVFAAKHVPIAQPLAMSGATALLDFARRRDAWIIEDAQGEDYILPRQGATLHSAAARDRVVYLGSFGRALFPALRLGFAIVPPSLAEAFAGARAIAGGYASLIDQMIVTDFMADGHLEQHVHRMRKIYAERRDCLLEAARRHAGGRLVLDGGTGAGMQMVGLLPGGQEAEAARRAAEARIELAPLSRFGGGHLPDGLLLGFSGFNGAQIDDAMRRLAGLLPG